MTTRLSTALALLTILVSSCRAHPAAYVPSPAQACGPLVRWKLPETLIVERTGDDTRTADILATQARVAAIIRAAEAYCRLSGGSYPANLDQMLTPPTSMSMCRLHLTDLTDAWGHPIFYAVVLGQLVIRSAGTDGRFGTEDDVGRPTTANANTENFEIPVECRVP